MTTVFTKNTIPIWVSVTAASFFAYTGRSSKPEKPAKMNRALSPMTATKGAVPDDVAIGPTRLSLVGAALRRRRHEGKHHAAVDEEGHRVRSGRAR